MAFLGTGRLEEDGTQHGASFEGLSGSHFGDEGLQELTEVLCFVGTEVTEGLRIAEVSELQLEKQI